MNKWCWSPLSGNSESWAYYFVYLSEACVVVIVTHTHLKDRPSCIQDIPKTCSSSWSQGEKIGLCKNCVKSCRKTCKSPQNSLGPSFSILCHHFKPHQQRPPVQCNQRRLKNVLSFTHLSAVFSSSVYGCTESRSASSVALHSPGTEDTPTNAGHWSQGRKVKQNFECLLYYWLLQMLKSTLSYIIGDCYIRMRVYSLKWNLMNSCKYNNNYIIQNIWWENVVRDRYKSKKLGAGLFG